jgi:outer membrane immunogenic protein
MVKRHLAILGVAVLGATAISEKSAGAADLPARLDAKAPPLDPGYNWTGFYLGAHAGYMLANATASAADTAAITATYGRMP